MPHFIIGIDEAGYGPTLGPLIVSAVVFETPQPRLNLWKSLGSVVSQDHRHHSKTGANRLIVCDSKRVYQPSRGIGLLERTVLTFLKQSGIKCWPISARQLINHLAYRGSAHAPHYYEDANLEIPLMAVPDDIDKCALILHAEMARKSIKFHQVVCNIIDVADFNQLIKRGNKADLLFSATAQLIAYIYDSLTRTGDKTHHLEFYIGKQGGRTYYRDLLSRLFTGHKVLVIRETQISSSYRIFSPEGSKCSVRFVRDGETASFTIALASMYAKYLREVLMRMFNRFYQQYLPELKPTAGYPQDARRFIKDITPLITQLNLQPEIFIRAR